jgi:peptidyl-prolyl cis-trans isomerase B (cyclophilin B)
MSQVKLTTNHGDILIELDAEKAPLSVANFLNYVRSGHYDGTVFHRVIKGFMVQGGGFEVGMKQKPTEAQIQNEANNGLKNAHYTLAMARTNAPHSATAQFFINTTNNGFLDFKSESPSGWGYASSARSSKARMSSTRSRSPRPPRAAAMVTCPSRTSSSRKPSRFDPHADGPGAVAAGRPAVRPAPRAGHAGDDRPACTASRRDAR